MRPDPDRSVHIELDLTATDGTLQGVIRAAGGAEQPVGGWLELIGTLEALLSGQPLPRGQ